MQLNSTISKAEAEALAAVCNEATSLLARINQMLEHNSDLAIDWNAAETPAYIAETAGNITGLNFARTDVGNAIGSLDWIRKLLTNQSMAGSQGDHLGNLNKLSRPLG